MLVNNVKSRFFEQQQSPRFPGYVRPWQATTSKQRKKYSQLRARSDRNLSRLHTESDLMITHSRFYFWEVCRIRLTTVHTDPELVGDTLHFEA